MKSISWRLRNLSIFALAAASAILHGAARRKIGAPRTIAIVQGARLGDMVCTTPLFRAVKRMYPKVRLIVVGDSTNEKLLEGHPDVDRYIVWKKNFRTVIKTLRREHADFGCIMLPSLEGLALLMLARVSLVAAPRITGGVSPYETATYKLLSYFAVTVPNEDGKYVPREYLRLLEPINIKESDTTKHLTYTETGKTRIEALLREEGIDLSRDLTVGILPAVGGDRLKRWAPEKFARLAAYLTEKHNAKIIVLGAGKDRREVEEMLEHLPPTTRVLNMLDRLSLDELKGLIARLSLFISADTGPIYIAEAFGTPTIDILGPVDENVQPPQGDFHRVVFVPREKAQLGVLDNIPNDRAEAIRQSEEITVEMVARVADELIGKIRAKKEGA